MHPMDLACLPMLVEVEFLGEWGSTLAAKLRLCR